jgi:hypothetical protein
MSVFTRTPENTNPLQPTKFLLSFNRSGSVPYFCQSVNIPGMSMGAAPFNTPTLDINYPGGKLSFNSLNITFILDEHLTSWKDIYNWMLANGHPDMNERNRLLEMQGGVRVSDAILTVLSGLNNPIARIQFHNAYPIDLTDINFDTTLSADTIITSTATFNFNYYEVLPLD